jgi:tetratricopeptide (TPR) repeat protein
VRGDRPIVERVASRHVVGREAVEAAYCEGDDAQRRELLAAAALHADAAPTGLLRLAVNGFDADLAAAARRALAQVESPDAVGLIGDALRVAISPQERDALVAALDRMGAQAPKARMLAAAQRGISGRSESIDAQSWIAAIDSDPGAPVPEEIAARLARQEEILAKGSAAELADLAEAFLARARDGEDDPGFARLLVLDAQETARHARAAGAYGWRVDALLANAAFLLGDREAARAHAVAAIAEVPARAAGEDAMVVLALLAEARWDAISKASLRKEPWPPEWFTDVHAAYSVLAHHPLGSDGQVAGHHDVLEWLGARGEAARVLARGLARHPDSPTLHERLRGQILREQGIGGLESAYESMLRGADASAHLSWFAGFASVVTAEFHRRAGDEAAALAAYQRAQAHYERCVNLDPETGESSAAWIAMIRAGRARLALERGDLESSLEELLAALSTAPHPWPRASVIGHPPLAPVAWLWRG